LDYSIVPYNEAKILLWPKEGGKEMTSKTFIDFVMSNKLTLENTVFVFPGNTSHQGGTNTLHSRKQGSGLADIANSLFEANVPTLGIPIRVDNHQQAENAIHDIWRAIGFGYNIVIPVRKHTKRIFFNQPIGGTRYEPMFWDEESKESANPSLGRYYVDNIKAMLNYETLKHVPDPMLSYYEEGRKNTTPCDLTSWYYARD
jgi:hypothetical protein